MTKYHVIVPVHVVIDAASTYEAKMRGYASTTTEDGIYTYPVHEYMIEVDQDMQDRIDDYRAAKTVITDQRKSMPDLQPLDALREARNNVSLEPAVGATVVDDVSSTADAYRRVLSWTDDHTEDVADRLVTTGF